MEPFSVELVEKETPQGDIVLATYTLIVTSPNCAERYLIGNAQKDTTFIGMIDGPVKSFHDMRYDIQRYLVPLGKTRPPPTPALLCAFSRVPLENALRNERPANLHPLDELSLMQRLLAILGERDPAIRADAPRNDGLLMYIADTRVSPQLHEGIRRAYGELCAGKIYKPSSFSQI